MDGVPYCYHRSPNATGGTLIWVEKVIETVASSPDRLSGIPHWLKPICPYGHLRHEVVPSYKALNSRIWRHSLFPLPGDEVHEPAEDDRGAYKEDKTVKAVADHLRRRFALGDAEDYRREQCEQQYRQEMGGPEH